ncbi:hypothetical protein OEZ85_013586 [Tetradesmus obliquus]|uniref:Uncharacterized protein n=1 Tax=Tetradesmus obliquus TaxID=3088 RepID=A0ABY8UQS2_TETOB|nr:hypothetical protein OEZ85_013586 [Tetradesmus obliquus]
MTCTLANYTACAQPGVVGCALLYSDLNVTSNLHPGKQVRVCNDAWQSFANFDKVAVVRGSILEASKVRESDAVARGCVSKKLEVC